MPHPIKHTTQSIFQPQTQNHFSTMPMFFTDTLVLHLHSSVLPFFSLSLNISSLFSLSLKFGSSRIQTQFFFSDLKPNFFKSWNPIFRSPKCEPNFWFFLLKFLVFVKQNSYFEAKFVFRFIKIVFHFSGFYQNGFFLHIFSFVISGYFLSQKSNRRFFFQIWGFSPNFWVRIFLF